MDGIFIPNEILHEKKLNDGEQKLLSFYRYYTLEGDKKVCYVSNTHIMEYLMLSRTTFFKMKQHLKELGLIKCEGKYVWYLSQENVPENSPEIGTEESPEIGTHK